ncbi:hypothetical protein PGTUg99_003912 [Puccinia graminis f. sp. tritici]|uniref:Uncharacterized protein n=1 Tax=Puccinia graminis f. sp. tritici TaxID=56615 RepID=A0A5B0RU76_PUCGR|nr:hypothetical protein PGTUg99_003912 [Puccinia graminis f. sp. tritici]
MRNQPNSEHHHRPGVSQVSPKSGLLPINILTSIKLVYSGCGLLVLCFLKATQCIETHAPTSAGSPGKHISNSIRGTINVDLRLPERLPQSMIEVPQVTKEERKQVQQYVATICQFDKEDSILPKMGQENAIAGFTIRQPYHGYPTAICSR